MAEKKDSAGKVTDPDTAEDLLHQTLELEERNTALERLLRQTGQALHEWVAAVDAIRDPIFMHDKDFRVVRANRAYAEAAGMDVKEIIGKRYWEVFPKNDGPPASCKRAIEERQNTEEEFRLPTGEEFVSRAFPVHDGEGRYLYSLYVLEDVTEKRKAETEQQLLSEATRQATEAVLVLDADTRIVYLNPAFYRLFGY